MILYFIGCNDHAIKIGFTDDVNRRLKQLQTGNPYELELYHLIDDINPQLEKFVHEFFESEHIKNEWYEHKIVSHMINHLKHGWSMQQVILVYDPMLYESFVYKQKKGRLPWWYNKIKAQPVDEQYDYINRAETPQEYIARTLEKWNKEHVSIF